MRLGLFVLCLATFGVPADKVDVTGKWQLSVELSAGSGNPTAEFKQDGEKITGIYRGRFGESKLEGTVKGNKIEFNVQITAEGNTFTAVYRGESQDDGTMKGTVDFGGFAEGTWTGRRAPANQKEAPKQS